MRKPVFHHLVLGRCGMDDVPIRLLGDRQEAVNLAHTVTPAWIKRAARRVLELDVSIICNVSVVTFRNGIPTGFVVVKEFTD
jgi:hypothetical protein